MTRARAIELLKGIQFCCDFDDCTNAWDCDECVDAFNMAIEALEQEPTAEYSSDVISRQAAIDAVKEAYENDEMFDGYEYRLQELPSAQPFTEEQIQTMQELESAQVEKAFELGKADRPTGHWIENAQEYYEMINEKGGGVDENTPYFTDDIACSECLAKFSVIDNETERFDFCPNCGCAMKGGKEE